MHITHVEIANFRALEAVSVPLNTFSVLIGENDVGKTSFLHALDVFFDGKKLGDKNDWYRKNTDTNVVITVTFGDVASPDLDEFRRSDGAVRVKKVFSFGQNPVVTAVTDTGEEAIPKNLITEWFSSDRFHFIPVRRDLSVQFSMAKSALLGKTLRTRMKTKLEDADRLAVLRDVESLLCEAIEEPRAALEKFMQEQMHNDAVGLGFDNLEVDPIEGVSFDVTLSDDRVEEVKMENRGSGTQNNLIIALFRLIADLVSDGDLILAMEEPENSLHPKAQRQLLSVIQEIAQSSQVIVTTHSPVFIDRSRFENNILMTRTASGNTIGKTFDISQLDQVRTDLGISASDALLKGGGNCALLVEGATEEDGFPTFMEMCGMSEFKLGIAIINIDGSDFQKTRTIAQLLHAYDIPCVIVLDRDAQKAADDLERVKENSLPNIQRVFCLSKGTIEDYFPLEVVAEVINQQFSPTEPVSANDFDASKSGQDRLNNFQKVMYEHGAGDSIRYLKRSLGGLGARLMKDRGDPLDPELIEIFETVQNIAAPPN